MTVVSDSSPLITLSKIGRLDVLFHLYHQVMITPQVYDEVAIKGAGLAGSDEITNATWIKIKNIIDMSGLMVDQTQLGLGLGELSAIALAKEIAADVVLIDEIKARGIARNKGLRVVGCVGILEHAFTRHLIPDLSQTYRDLLGSGAYVDRGILERSLRSLNLPPL